MPVYSPAQPIHWVYDEGAMQKVLDVSNGIPEFVNPSVNPFYTLHTGSQSLYGDALIVMLESLVASKGLDWTVNMCMLL